MSILNYNPGIYNTLGPFGAGGVDETDDPEKQNVLDWILANGEDAADVVDSVLCVINPRRPGCRGNVVGGGSGGAVTQQQNNAILYAILAVVLVLLIVFIFKK